MVKFVITGAARSGSTMLRYLLDSHTQIACHGEIFRRRMKWGFIPSHSIGLFSSKFDNAAIESEKLAQQWANSDIKLFFDQHIFCARPKIHAYGLKFKTDEYFDPFFSKVSLILRQDIDIKVIHLQRRDLLAQYISHVMVQKGHHPTVSFGKHSSSSHIRLNLDVKKMSAHLMDILRREEKMGEAFCEHETLYVWYENLVDKLSEELERIVEFLHVDQQVLHSKTEKLIADHYNLIENKAEVLSCLSNLPLQNRYIGAQLNT